MREWSDLPLQSMKIISILASMVLSACESVRSPAVGPTNPREA